MTTEIEIEPIAQASLAEAVAAYIPENVVATLAAQNTRQNQNPHQPQLLNAVTMMVDITGFTPLCEALAKKGREGAEQVTTLINLFFEEALKPVKQQGGVIAKFGGDAFIAFFEQLSDESWETTAGRALYSAFALQKLVQKYQDLRLPGSSDGQVFQLYAKVGLGAGTFLAFGVGIPEKHCDYQVVGEPLNQAAEAEHHATRGEIIIHNELLAFIGTVPAYLELGPEREICHPVVAYNAPDLAPLAPLFNLNSLTPPRLTEFLLQASSYIPRAVYERLKLGYLALPGEHRRVISLFINFTGFSWLQDETAPAKFNQYYLAMLEAVERHGGYLNRISSGDKGDLMHVLFGAPVTHQDDDERAVRCALELQQVARRFEYIQSQKIGLSSGFVFAGDIGSPGRHEYTVIGDTVNLSARLMQIAEDWTVLVDAATVQRVSDRFEFGEPRPVQLKGKANFVDVREALRSHENEAVIRRTTQQPIFGRERELAAVRQILLQVLSGETRLLAINGEPGIGKTFFLERVLTAWQAAAGHLVQTRLVNYERRPFGLWAKWLSQLAGIDSKTNPNSSARRLSQFVSSLAPELVEWLPLWGELLELPLTEATWLRALDRPTRRQRLIEYTTILLERLAKQQPLLLFCDDFQWADSASLELLDQIFPLLKNVPLVVCVGYRSDQLPELKLLKNAQCSELLLAPLSPEASREFILTRLADKLYEVEPETFIKNVIELSGGNPFFIEELLDTLQAANSLSLEKEKALVGNAKRDLFSYNLHTLIMDRLDSLDGRLREVILAAAVVGGDLSDAILKPLLPSNIAETLTLATGAVSPLKILHRLDLLLPEASGLQEVYRFRHALIQQVAYESLPFARRRILHEQVGNYFEESAAPDAHLERLAYHYEHSHNDQKAVLYLAKSAAKSARLFANSEALQLYKNALQRAANCPEPTTPNQAQLLTGLGDVQALTADFNAALASYEQAFEFVNQTAFLEYITLDYKRCDVLVRAARFPEAVAIIEARQSDLQLYSQKRGYKTRANLLRAQFTELHSIILGRQSKYEEAYKLAETGLQFLGGVVGKAAEATQIKIRLLQGQAAAAAALRHINRAETALNKALLLNQKEENPITEGQLQLRLGILNMQADQVRKAPQYFYSALPLIEKTGARDRLANVLIPGGNTFLFRGEYKQAQEWLERGLKLAEEINSTFLLAAGQNVLGMVFSAMGQWDAALDIFETAMVLTKQHGFWDRYGDNLCRQAQIQTYRGNFSAAEKLLNTANECAVEYKLPVLLALAQRFQAETLLAQGYIAQAIECLASAAQPALENLNSVRVANSTLVLSECTALNILQKEEKPARATAELAQQALNILQTFGFKLFLPTAFRINGLLSWAMGDTSSAFVYLGKGISLAKTTGYLYEFARLSVLKEQIKLRTQPDYSVKTAKTHLNNISALLKNLEAHPELAKVEQLLTSFYQ